MRGTVLLRVVLCSAGIACLAVGLYPRSSGGRTDSPRSEFTLGLPCSPLYRSTTTVSETSVEDADRTLVRRHDESRTTRVELLSWSAALVAAGTALLVVSFRRRAKAAP